MKMCEKDNIIVIVTVYIILARFQLKVQSYINCKRPFFKELNESYFKLLELKIHLQIGTQ